MTIPFKKLNTVTFPQYTGIKVNMMPIIMGDIDSIPADLRGYLPLIENCNFKYGETVYLSVHESFVEAGQTQRRPGVHTEATSNYGWGGWGGLEEEKGIYMASTDGRCKVWNCLHSNVDKHGGIVGDLSSENEEMNENTMYWLGDKTPHESLPSKKTGQRQWFRLVSPDIGAWFTEHNTANPLGVQAKALITNENKFI